jgi:hypothetical protein
MDPCEDITAVAPKRRLPVLRQKDGDDSPPRPRAEWVGFGAAIMIVAWLPLAGLATAIVARMRRRMPGDLSDLPDARVGRLGAAMVALPALSIVLACLFGGYLLGRWGKRGRADAAASAALAMVFGIGITWTRFGMTWEGVVALVLAVPAAVLGASLGARRRTG